MDYSLKLFLGHVTRNLSQLRTHKNDGYRSFFASVLSFVDKPNYYSVPDRALLFVPKVFLDELPSLDLTPYTNLVVLVSDARAGHYYLRLTHAGMLSEIGDERPDEQVVQRLRKLYLDFDKPLGKSSRKHIRQLRSRLTEQLFDEGVAYIHPSSPFYLTFARHFEQELTKQRIVLGSNEELGSIRLKRKKRGYALATHKYSVVVLDL